MWQSVYGSVGEPGQDGGEVLTDRDLESAAAFDDGEDCGDAWSCFLVPDVGPVATANRDSPDILPMSVRN